MGQVSCVVVHDDEEFVDHSHFTGLLPDCLVAALGLTTELAAMKLKV